MGRILLLGLGIGASALAGTVPAEGILDLILVGAAGVSALLTGVAAMERKRIDSLPLQLAERGVRGVIGGRPVCGFRGWLGRGRVVKSPAIEVSFTGIDGVERQLIATLPTDLLCGPWTFHVPDPGTDGQFIVRVAVQEGSRSWEALGRWDREHLSEGRFASPVSVVGGRLRWNRDGWNQIEEAQR